MSDSTAILAIDDARIRFFDRQLNGEDTLSKDELAEIRTTAAKTIREHILDSELADELEAIEESVLLSLIEEHDIYE